MDTRPPGSPPVIGNTPGHQRALAALQALAVGEAMGRITEHYQPAEIVEVYDDLLEDFIEPVRLFDDDPWQQAEVGALTTAVLSALLKRTVVTDDAETRSLALLLAGVLNGGMPVAESGAEAAVGAMLAAAMQGVPISDALIAVLDACAPEPDLRSGVSAAAGIAQSSGGRGVGDQLMERFSPHGGLEALLPFVIGVVYATQSARRAILEAVNHGGNAPLTAALAGLLAAALAPQTLPGAWVAEVAQANQIDFAAVLGDEV